VRKLAATVGVAMARRHGIAGYSFAIFPDHLHNDMTSAGVQQKIQAVVTQVERLLLGRP
jgi:hypothetical protein